MIRLGTLLLCAALSAPAANWYVTVTGLPGEPDYEQRFKMWGSDLDKILKGSGGEAKVETLQAATREAVRASLGRIAREAKPDDSIVVTLIGHGTFDGVDYKFNLPGPDITASELATLLDRIPASRQLVVNMTSSSGGSIDALRRPNRIVISATKSGTERNATIFARYWVEALRDTAADTDKNESISALEAFRYAEQKTANFYQTQKRLATEHPLFEDTGKGSGVRIPSPETGEGRLAASFPVLRIGGRAVEANNPEKRKLMAQRERIEEQIDKLKFEKAAMPLDEYKKQLGALLLELAKVQEELEK